MAKKRKLKVGEQVRLNDMGLEIIFGRKLGLAHMKTKIYTVTCVGSESMTYPVETFPIEVDDPELNSYLLDDWHFDRVI